MLDTTRTPASELPEPIPFDQRMRRVLELKRQIREGTYRPDAKEIARAILAHWFALGLELENETTKAPVDTSVERRAAAARFVVPPTATDVAVSDSLTA